jgi:putative ABC transport system ATP-binding protein
MYWGIDLEINKGEYVADGTFWFRSLPNESFRLFRHPTSGTYILNGQDVSKQKMMS